MVFGIAQPIIRTKGDCCTAITISSPSIVPCDIVDGVSTPDYDDEDDDGSILIECLLDW